MSKKTITMEEREFLSKYSNGSRAAFIEAFIVKFKDKIPPSRIYNRSSYLWADRQIHIDILKKDIAKKVAVESANHTVMIPRQVKTQATTKASGDGFPDVGELLVKQNNLLAEMIALQKETLHCLNSIQTYNSAEVSLQTEMVKVFTELANRGKA